MSNQFSALLDFRSLSIFAPFNGRLKPYSTLRSVIPFHHNLIVTGGRSRRRTTSLHPSPPLAAQSSTNIDLIATTEHHDGSLIFRFGDASEVQKNDELVEILEDEAKGESKTVTFFDGYQAREVTERQDESGSITELADSIGAVDTDRDGIQTETNRVLGVSDSQEESSERMLEIYADKVFSSVSDDKLNYSPDGENALDIRQNSTQVGKDESSNPMIASISLSKDRDSEEAFVEDSVDETEEQSTSVKLEPTMQVSDIDILDGKETNVEDTGDSDTQDIIRLSNSLETEMIPQEVSQLQPDPVEVEPTTQLSTTEAIDAKDQVVEDGMEQMSLDKSGENDLMDVMHVSSPVNLQPTMQLSHIEIMDGKEKNFEDTGDSDMKDVLPLSNSLDTEIIPQEVSQLQPDPVEVEPTTQLSTTEAIDAKDQVIEDGMEQMNLDDSGENDLMDVKQVSSPVNLQPTVQVSTIEVRKTSNQNLDDGITQSTDEYPGESYVKDLMSPSNPVDAQPFQNEEVTCDSLEQNAEADGPESSITVKQEIRNTLLEAESIESEVNISELAEVSGDEAVQFLSELTVEREEISLADYFLSSGAALLVQPPKALTGGDNAYFVGGGKWLGVADGVSRWSLEGTHSGVYAQELIKTCKKIVLDGNIGPISNPVELLSKVVRETDASGSSTILIAHFDGQVLHVANIGDTGFMIIRHGAVYKKSSPMFHEFNFPLQIERGDDPSQLVEEYRIELDEGDTVVSATDGLFDNLYEKEIAMIVSKSLQTAMKPEEIAKVLAARAQEVGRSAFVRSPFADAAQAAGYIGYTGGKPDDVAVIVSLVERKPNLHIE